MVYNYFQQLYSSGIKGVYQITTYDKSIGTFWFFVSDFMRRNKNKTWHKPLISKWYKYLLRKINFFKYLLQLTALSPFNSDDLYLFFASHH